MPACSWNCITYGDKVIKVVPSVIAGIATIVTGFIGYAATRRGTQHTGTTGKRDIDLSSFEGLVMDLFGDLGHPNITYMDPLNGTVMGVLGDNHIEIQDDGVDVIGYINMLETPKLLPRQDTLTGAKVIYQNARVDGSIQVRKFSKTEAQEIGNRVSTNFESVCNHYGRAMCDCVRSAQGDGWTAAMRVEGQANNNGKYQAISCPSGCNVNERDL